MSKAFTKDTDEEDSESEIESPALKTGGKNYITELGEKRLRAELHQLLHVERPKLVETITWAAGNGDRSENADYIYGKRRLREIDRRVRFLSKRLESAEVIDPLKVQSDQIRFGATVKLKTSGGEKTYTIVGVDETNASLGWISWISPLGKALLKGRVGDIVSFRSPRGDEEVEILQVSYLKLDGELP